jgi:hypothetical protein
MRSSRGCAAACAGWAAVAAPHWPPPAGGRSRRATHRCGCTSARAHPAPSRARVVRRPRVCVRARGVRARTAARRRHKRSTRRQHAPSAERSAGRGGWDWDDAFGDRRGSTTTVSQNAERHALCGMTQAAQRVLRRPCGHTLAGAGGGSGKMPAGAPSTASSRLRAGSARGRRSRGLAATHTSVATRRRVVPHRRPRRAHDGALTHTDAVVAHRSRRRGSGDGANAHSSPFHAGRTRPAAREDGANASWLTRTAGGGGKQASPRRRQASTGTRTEDPRCRGCRGRHHRLPLLHMTRGWTQRAAAARVQRSPGTTRKQNRMHFAAARCASIAHHTRTWSRTLRSPTRCATSSERASSTFACGQAAGARD